MFVHTALTWGFFLALVPLLIHLINLVRRRRVKWAAMDFLWQSYRKHQKWIWLQQLLLLLLRMAAVIVAVAMLAQWLAKNQLFSLLSGRVTHHFVLLDDSLSMSERFGGTTAFDKATQTLSRIAAQAMAQESPQKMTVVRFSRAAGVPQNEAAGSVGQLADLNGEPVDAKFDVLLEDQRRGLQVTQLAIGPRPALELVHKLAGQTPDEGHIVHILSDFRNRDWANPAELKQLLEKIDDTTEQIQFVHCAPEVVQTNLAVTDLRPGEDIRAAGVPLSIEVTVANFGQETARKIPVKIRSTYFDPQLTASAEPGKLTGKLNEPPTVLIEELAAGQSTTRQVQVFFPQAGQHFVEAILPEDVVHADNKRWCIVDIPEGESVLAIDGDPQERNNVYYLTAAFQPGPRAPTGIRVESKSTAFLRDATPESLAVYRAIYLLDVDRLEERAVENLESFVRAGGGLGIFVGEHVQHSFYTSRLFREGEGVFPLPLEREDFLPSDAEDNVPDFEVTNHPLFSIFFGERNPFIRLVTVEQYLRPSLSWAPEPNSTTAVIARLRNRQPLVVERQFGEGRVVAFLTTLAPLWNNWANDPSFVVVLLKLQSYLAAPQRKVDPRLVGSPLSVQLVLDAYRPDLTFVTPGDKPDFPIVLRRTAAAEPQKNSLTGTLAGLSRDEANTSRSGIYEVWPTTVAGPLEVRRFAFNVNPAESDITQVSSRTLLAGLAPTRIRMRRADDLAFELTEEAGLHRGTWLIGLLILMLIGEQILAYVASYHPTPVTGVTRE